MLVTHVSEDSPAEKSGIKAEDIIIEVNNESISSTGQLRSRVGKHKIGDEIEIAVLRNGKKKVFEVEVGEPAEVTAREGRLHRLLEGASFEDSEENDGVVVTSLAPNSTAAYSGLRVGNVIVGTNKVRVKNMRDFSKALKRDDKKALLRVKRGRSAFYLVIR